MMKIKISKHMNLEIRCETEKNNLYIKELMKYD